jgi:DNA polymerase III subunit delta'
MQDKSKSQYKWPLMGNKKNIGFLSRSLANNKLSSAYIFSGPDNLGKTKLAEHFSKIILCQKKDGPYSEKPCEDCESCRKFNSQKENEDFAHSDFYVVKKEKDKKNISVDQVRCLIHSLSMSSFSDSYKIGIIKHAETLNESASNTLLKLLEEPRKKVIIILVSSNIEKMLKTIVSRCQLLDFVPLEIEIINKYLLDNYSLTRSAAKNYSRVSLGRPALAIKFVEDKEFYKNYLDRLEKILNIIESNNCNKRFSLIEELIDKKMSTFESAVALKRLLEIFQGVLRDLYLMNYGLNDLVQNEIFDSRLKEIKIKNDVKKIIKVLDEIEMANDYMEANVNSKLILENITLSL